MTAQHASPPGVSDAPVPSAAGIRSRTARPLLVIGAVLFVVSAVRVFVEGADDLTSSGTTRTAITITVPILLAGLGGLLSERAGVVNIGLEGMMILGTWFGAWGGYRFGPWWGVALAAIGGGLGGLVHAVAVVHFNVDHIVSGVAINLLAPGFARYLANEVFTPVGGGATQSPDVGANTGVLSVPMLAGGDLFGWSTPDPLRWIEDKGWYLVSDLSGMIGGSMRDIPWLAVLAYAFVPIIAFVLWRTRLGLRLRSSGENPGGAESLGVNVYRMRYLAVIASGSLAGIGGAMLVIENASIYRENQTGGRGFIGLAAMLFGSYRPVGTMGGSLLFGYVDGLQRRSPETVHAALLLIGALAIAGLAIGLVRHRTKLAIMSGLTATVTLWYWAVSEDVAGDLVFVAPYAVTLVVLAIKSQRVRPPAATGQPYRRGDDR
jgi:general nucleoside transport system permease protein